MKSLQCGRMSHLGVIGSTVLTFRPQKILIFLAQLRQGITAGDGFDFGGNICTVKGLNGLSLDRILHFVLLHVWGTSHDL